MMKLKNIFILFATLFVLASCSQDGADTLQPQEPETQIYKLYLHSSFEGFDSRGEGRSYEPKHGDKMIFLLNGTSAAAEYYETRGYWVMYTSFPHLLHGQCSVIYCGSESSWIQFSAGMYSCGTKSKTAIFTDDKAVYSFKDQEIDLYTTLTPKTCRVRFKSNTPYSFNFLGIGYYSYIDSRYDSEIVFGRAEDKTPVLSETTSSDDGYYSSYHYVFSIDGRPLIIKCGDYAYRWKKDPAEYFKPNRNGVIEMPDIRAENWIKETYRHWKYEDINVPYSDSGQWTQETLAKTRFDTQLGLRYNFTCTFKLKDSSSETYPFQIKIEALNNNGDVVDAKLIKVFTSDFSAGSEKTFDGYYYHKDASAYRFSFYSNKVYAQISDFSMRNF